MTRPLQLLVPLLLVLTAACGGDDDEPTTLSERTTTSTAPADDTDTSATAETDEVPTTEDMEAMLLTLDDLPAGWTTGASSDEEESFCPALDADESLKAAEKAEASFQRSEQGPFVEHAIGGFEDTGQAEDAIARFRQGLEECREFEIEQDGQKMTGRLSALSVDTFGDETFAARVTVDAEMFTIEGDMVLVREGRVVSLLAHLAVGEVDTDLTMELVEAAAENLE